MKKSTKTVTSCGELQLQIVKPKIVLECNCPWCHQPIEVIPVGKTPKKGASWCGAAAKVYAP